MLKFFANKSGATAIEYSLIAALIAIVIVGAASAVGAQTSDTLNAAANGMAAAA